MTKALDHAREQRAATSQDKRDYVRSLLQGDPQLDDRTLGDLVEKKFGSGLARRNMDEVRHDLGWVWKHEHGKRSRVLVRLDASNTNREPVQTAAQPASTPAPVVTPRTPPPLSADEQLEVDLIARLQALMQRQGYQSISIPAQGTAQIRLLVVREKVPGEHLDAQPAHH